jgi:hypothetical protein
MQNTPLKRPHSAYNSTFESTEFSPSWTEYSLLGLVLPQSAMPFCICTHLAFLELGYMKYGLMNPSHL